MTGRSVLLTSTDLELLAAVARTGSVAAASRAVGMSRDRGTYRLGRLPRLAGGAVVVASRGGDRRGGTRLTARGWGLLRRAADALGVAPAGAGSAPARANRLHGVWRAHPQPRVELADGTELAVSFSADDGEPVTVAIDPESILLARRRFPTSARNVIPARVRRVRWLRSSEGVAPRRVELEVGGGRMDASVTEPAVRELQLRAGARVYLYLKATAIRRLAGPPRRAVPTRGRPRS
ncbi:MAG TPA: TOBE domain-containing protein [Thermoplasmata archaeon]|nr:TOBE domain-containing protein [Thermoplasmata archaeon]